MNLCLISASVILAGQPYLGTGIGDVVVATVKQVENQDATQGDPPRVTLEVHEVLRGDPKIDRARGVWTPPPFDNDTAGGEEYRRELARWKAVPFKVPKAVTNFVLWGESAGPKEKPTFQVYSWHAYPFTPAKRKWAIDDIRQTRERLKKLAEEREAEQRKLTEAQAKWRAKTSAEDLAKFAESADFVATGKIVSEAPHNVEGGILIQVDSVLKGKLDREFSD